MSREKQHKVIADGRHYMDTSDVPKDTNIGYRCMECHDIVPSIPSDNIGCGCGNIFIDRDCWRLVVVDLSKLQVVELDME
jgi:hypothetical protein